MLFKLGKICFLSYYTGIYTEPLILSLGLQNLKYILLGSTQKTLADPCIK